MEATLQIIQTVGFPAGAFILMYWLVRDTLNELRKSIEDNTRAITAICSMMQQHILEKDKLIEFLERKGRPGRV